MPDLLRRWGGWLLTLVALAMILGVLLLDRPQSRAERARELSERLRCHLCQPESIADSPAAMAREMRGLVEEQVEQGKSDAEILDSFRARYGDWMLLEPSTSRSTLLVWVLPIAVVAAGLAAVLASRSQRKSTLPSDPGLRAERRTQAERDLVELDQRVASGDLEPEIAERLRPIYGEELAALNAALAAPTSDDDASPMRAARNRTLVGSAVVLIASVGFALVVQAQSTRPRPEGAAVTSNDTAAEPRDLSQVSNEEMEDVIRANPTVVPMRLALVERYLRDGELEKARDHARTALEHNPAPGDKQRALKYLGWATASLGDTASGVQLLEESLSMAPGDIDAKWFLAQVRLEALGDRAGAVALFESILADEALPADKRAAVESKLSEARRPA